MQQRGQPRLQLIGRALAASLVDLLKAQFGQALQQRFFLRLAPVLGLCGVARGQAGGGIGLRRLELIGQRLKLIAVVKARQPALAQVAPVVFFVAAGRVGKAAFHRHGVVGLRQRLHRMDAMPVAPPQHGFGDGGELVAFQPQLGDVAIVEARAAALARFGQRRLGVEQQHPHAAVV